MVLAYAARSQVKTSVRIGTASLPLGIWSASYSSTQAGSATSLPWLLVVVASAVVDLWADRGGGAIAAGAGPGSSPP